MARKKHAEWYYMLLEEMAKKNGCWWLEIMDKFRFTIGSNNIMEILRNMKRERVIKARVKEDPYPILSFPAFCKLTLKGKIRLYAYRIKKKVENVFGIL